MNRLKLKPDKIQSQILTQKGPKRLRMFKILRSYDELILMDSSKIPFL